MFSLCEQLTDRGPFFMGGDYVILPQTVLERVAVFAVKERHPARLLAQVLQD